MTAPEELKPTQFGRYLLLDRINVGGMAEVFRGKSSGVEGFERLVALKRILPQVAADPDFIEMFVDEAKLAVQLQHANIAQIYDLGKADGAFYIAMEYIAGVDLKTMWDRARTRRRLLPRPLSCYVIQKCCEGLDAAHKKKDGSGRPLGLVHRDVSPHNVLVSFEGEVKIIDFGIAKAKTKISKTQAGALKGKFNYMSPEQVRGVELDQRSDIFACGIMLYELLVGDRLFRAESEFAILEMVRKAEISPPSERNKQIDPELDRIVMKALSRERDVRYQWASEMAEDLQRHLYGAEVIFSRTDLQRYMQQHFGDEITAEKTRTERLQAIAALPPAIPRSSDSHPSAVDLVAGPIPEPTSKQPSPVANLGLTVAQPDRTAIVERSAIGGAPATAVAPTAVLPAPAVQVGENRQLPTWAAMLIGILGTLFVLTALALGWVLLR